MERWNDMESKKIYLKQYRNAIRREKRILEEIQRLRMDKMFPSVFIDNMPRGTDIKDLSDYIVLLEEEIDKLRLERLEKMRRYRDIESKIKNISDDDKRETLRLHYITGMTWEEVADEMGFTYRHIMRIHKEALNSLKMS